MISFRCIELDDIKASVKGIYYSSKFLTCTSDLPSNAIFGILLDRTNFYAEQGGQENDTGVLAIDGKAEFIVEDVQVYNGYVLHIGHMEEGELKVGDELLCTHDEVGLLLLVMDCPLQLIIRSCGDGLSEIIIPGRTS